MATEAIDTDTDTTDTRATPNIPELTDEKLANVKEVFSLFDRDNDGAIVSRDVICVLRSIGYNPTEQQVQKLLDIYDAEGEGMVEFATFLELLGKLRHEGETADEVEEAFRVFDPTGSGYINAVDLRQVMTSLGEKLSEEEADDMIAYADRAGNGEINYRDLIDILVSDGDW